MNRKRLLHWVNVGMLLSIAGLVDFGCGTSETQTATGGAGIPGLKGPASPKTNAFAKGAARAKAGPGGKRAAPATTPAPEAAESEKASSAPQP
jgi:hypothetical protein